MASHSAKNFIDVMLDSLAGTMFDKIRQYIAHQLFHFGAI
jgi:hypothetical protein